MKIFKIFKFITLPTIQFEKELEKLHQDFLIHEIVYDKVEESINSYENKLNKKGNK